MTKRLDQMCLDFGLSTPTKTPQPFNRDPESKR